MNEFEAMERIEPVNIEAASRAPTPVVKATLEDKLQQLQPGGLPYEPPPAAADANADQGQVLRQLFNFYLFGKVPAAAGPSIQETGAVPALLHQYRDLARIRHDYPFCLHGVKAANAVSTLSQIIDCLVAGVTDSGDAGERLKQHIHRIEPEIRALADQDRAAGLLGLWDRAAKYLLTKSQLSPAKKEQLRDNLATARKTLPDREMIACDADTPERLLIGLALMHWRERCAGWRSELESLIQQLSDILSIDFNNSPESRDPQHLRDATATTDAIDFKTLSSILATSHLEHPLPERRSQRIRVALDALVRVQPLIMLDPASPGSLAAAPIKITELFDNCNAASAAYSERLRLLTDFFKAVAIARLELENRYRESVHDEYFQHYDSTYLERRELALCPPVLIKLKCSRMTQADVPVLLSILTADLPIKVLVQVDDLYVRNSSVPPAGIAINWPARLASLAMSMTRAYVLQSPVSRLQIMHQGFLDGLDYNGPALFSVYVGNEANRGGLPRFFDAGTAQESRVFPVFTFNPGKGDTLIERLAVSENSMPDQDWPTDVFRYRAADDSEKSLALKFTSAGFLLNDKRFTDQFWCIPPSCVHENLLPLQDYLAKDSKEIQDKIPYIRTVDVEGCLQRVIMTRQVVDTVRECASYWRHLQELGGINNSYTLRQIAEASTRLAAEKQQEMAAIEEQYRLRMDQDVGKLTETIVGRIAQQLLHLGATPASGPLANLSSLAPVIPTAPAMEAAPAPKPAAKAAADEDEEGATASLDDPYIDTPLCTSCNDCTKLNSQLFAYDGNKQAFIKDATAGPYKDLVRAAEICPVKIIHPGKPKNPNEPGLDELMQRAAKFN
ncbi:MAG: hypothetical protein HW386_880 [Gammaproteobacteria bacterium]|nr:hypothetical protein [Gammaproteobacteria bacterium]